MPNYPTYGLTPANGSLDTSFDQGSGFNLQVERVYETSDGYKMLGGTARFTSWNGGAGIANPITGSVSGQNVAGTYYFAGGGGGGVYVSGTAGTGGNGGGGAGGRGNPAAGTAGTPNTGGGGGGSGGYIAGGSGGSGIVIIAYPTL